MARVDIHRRLRLTGAWPVVAVVATLGCATDDSPSGDGTTEGASTGVVEDSTSAAPADSTTASVDTGPVDGDDSGSSDGTVMVPDPVPDDCITEVTAGHHVFRCGDFDFDVEVPATCLEVQCGLVVDVHGYTMDAAMENKNTGLRELGAERGYVVIQPNANPAPPNSSWNVEDDAVVFDFAMRTVDAFHLDEARLHFTGFSQGGFMSWRFLCKYGDVFASIAPGAACSASAIVDGCSPADEPFAGTPHVLYIHGLTDALVPYEDCAEPQRDSVLAAYAMAGPPQSVDEASEHRWNRWTSADGVVFEMIDHDYRAVSPILAGHCFPGSVDLEADLPGQFLAFGCSPESPLSYGEVVMDFFEAHPKL